MLCQATVMGRVLYPEIHEQATPLSSPLRTHQFQTYKRDGVILRFGRIIFDFQIYRRDGVFWRFGILQPVLLDFASRCCSCCCLFINSTQLDPCAQNASKQQREPQRRNKSELRCSPIFSTFASPWLSFFLHFRNSNLITKRMANTRLDTYDPRTCPGPENRSVTQFMADFLSFFLGFRRPNLITD